MAGSPHTPGAITGAQTVRAGGAGAHSPPLTPGPPTPESRGGQGPTGPTEPTGRARALPVPPAPASLRWLRARAPGGGWGVWPLE